MAFAYIPWILSITFLCYILSASAGNIMVEWHKILEHQFHSFTLQYNDINNIRNNINTSPVQSRCFTQLISRKVKCVASCIIYSCNEVPIDPDSKVHRANVGPTWVLPAPDGPHVGPMNLAIRGTHLCGTGIIVRCRKY